MFIHTESSTVFQNFDELRLWLAKERDTAVSETQPDLSDVLLFFGISDYVAPVTPTTDPMIAESLFYLASTDWYFVRFIDTGEAVPTEIKQKRAEARAYLNQ